MLKNENMTHGLFGKIKGVDIEYFEDLKKIQSHVEQLSYKKTNMFKGVIAFKPDIAEELNLKNRKDWEEYIEKEIITIAKGNRIKISNLNYLCAVHKEKSNPHIHIMFWDKKQRYIKNFVKPELVKNIRRKLIKSTFEEKIQKFYSDRKLLKEDITKVTDEMVDEFDNYMKGLSRKEFKKQKSKYNFSEREKENLFYGLLKPKHINEFAPKLFELSHKMPKQGRLYYKLLDEDRKKEVDKVVEYIKDNLPNLQKLCDGYVKNKVDLSLMYETNIDNQDEVKEKAEDEVNKLMANKILREVKNILYYEKEVKFKENQIHYEVENMLYELYMFLDNSINKMENEIGMKTKNILGFEELSKRAKKEWYLLNKDKGMEK